MDNHNAEFHISEYNGLRSEIFVYVKQRINAVIYTVTANAATLGFIISNNHNENKLNILVVIAAWLPTLVSIIGWVHYYENIRNIKRMVKYCMLLEEKFALVGFGWDSYREKNRENFRARYLYNTVFLLQLVLAIYVGVLITSGLHN